MSNRGYFTIVARKSRAHGLVPALRAASMNFKLHYANRDERRLVETSKRAWNTMSKLFEVLRNEEDQGRLDSSYMTKATALVADGVSDVEQAQMIAVSRLDRKHPRCAPLSLRDTLNKIAHYDTATAAFRVDRRGAHYLILGGRTKGGRRWVAEILVARLCNNAAAAVKAIA